MAGVGEGSDARGCSDETNETRKIRTRRKQQKRMPIIRISRTQWFPVRIQNLELLYSPLQ
jgi:hypothetical protein